MSQNRSFLKNIYILSALFFALLMLVPSVYSKEIELKDIQIEDFAEMMRINLSFNTVVDYDMEMLEHPSRLMVILRSARVQCKLGGYVVVGKGGVKRVRLSYSSNKKFVRYIIVELVHKAEYAVMPEGNMIIVDIYKSPEIREEEKASQTRLARTLSGEVKLKDCLDVAYSNSIAMQIANEDLNLARFKVKEAGRNLFPSMVLKWNEVRGEAVRETGTPDFQERTYGVEMGQPIYQGGRLNAIFQQAKIGLKMAETNFNKIRNDLKYEVRNSFYNMLGNKLKIKKVEGLAKRCKNLLRLSSEKYRSKLITKLEHLNASFIYETIQYQLNSIGRDLSIAQLNLELIMNIEPVPLELVEEIKINPLDTSLEHCLALALSNRPELSLAELEVETRDLDRRVAKSENRLKIDLIGFYGRSGGAYKTEPLELDNDWSFGIKVTKALGGSTLSTSGTSDETSPKLGQTTRTKSEAAFAKFSILDNLLRFSKEKEAEVKYRKAEDEFDKKRDKVIQEVHEAYYNCQKALEQMESSKEEIELRKENLKIAKYKNRHNLLEISDVMKAEEEFTDAYLNQIDARIFYIQSLADLNKTIGVDKF